MLSLAIAAGLLLSPRGETNLAPVAAPVEQAPPPAPPPVSREGSPAPAGYKLAATTPTLYSIGDPTAEEQLYLEFMNRARANPTAEGERLRAATDGQITSSISFFNVNLDLMASQFTMIPPAPPLSMSSKLLAAARGHTKDMFDHAFQGHTGTDGSLFQTRISNAGYNWQTVGENVFSYADSPWEGHAGFEIDWGSDPLGINGGMQNPPGHRNSIHNPAFREVGVGVFDGVNGTGDTAVGPQLVTEDFASQLTASPTPFITGVIYYDLDGDHFYSIGEGLSGVTITVNGSAFYAVSANSGGYSVPVTTNGTYQVIFSGPGIASHTNLVTVTNAQNVKLDFVPAYSAPALSGPSQVEVNATNNYQFTLVGGATGYQSKITKLEQGEVVEGAEGSLTGVTLDVSAGYPSVDSSTKFSGTNSFLLSHINSTSRPPDQFLTLNHVFWPGTNSLLTFESLLTFSSPNQVAVVQLSVDGGSSWTNIWSRIGDGSSGDAAFAKQSVGLSNYIGEELELRFGYLFKGGAYFPATSGKVGWHLDDITLKNTGQLLDAVTNDVAAGALSFVVHTDGTYLLTVRPKVSDHYLGWSTSQQITAAYGPLNIHLGALLRNGSEILLPFSVVNLRPTTGFELETSADLINWSADNLAVLTNTIPGTGFQFGASARSNRLFYRVKSK